MSDKKLTEDNAPEVTDIFLWANNTDGIKNDFDIELFLFNKNYTPYSTSVSSELDSHLAPMFLYDIINTVNLGAGTGLSVREFEMHEAEEGVLLRTSKDKVGRAETLLHLIEHERNTLDEFSDEEHDFKRIKGVVAKFTPRKEGIESFYIIKAINQSAAIKSRGAWQFSEGSFEFFKPDFGVKIPTDNHVLIVGNDIFVFNQSKFEKLFQYNYKKQVIAEEKIKEIEAQYKLSFADGLDIQTIVRDRPALINKLQKIEVGQVSQDQVVEYADEMQLELMTDDANAILIMESRDLDMFVGLINEDYMTSEITGKRYEIKSKKLLDEPSGGEPPRG